MSPTREVAVFCIALLAAAGAWAQETPPPPPATPPPAAAVAAPAVEAPAAVPSEPDPAVLAAKQQAKDAFKKGAWQEAGDAALIVLAALPKDLESLYIAGASERQTNRFTEAEGHLRTLVEASPIFPLAHFQLGYVLFIRAEGMVRGGQVEPAKAAYAEAASEFGKELERNPTHAPSLSSRAIALSRAGQVDESVVAHEAWITAAPQKNDPVVSLAATFAGAGRATEAMATLERIPDKSPKASFDAAFAVASVFVARRDWGAAVPFLEKAAEIDPTSTKARALLVESCARAGLPNDAVRNLLTLLTMEPTPEEAESVGEAIKSSLGNGRSAPSVDGLEPPALLRLPSPKYPKGQDDSVETEVLVLAQIRQDAAVMNTVMVPNRIWKDMRASGFEAAAFDAVKRGKFVAGTKDGKTADLWIVVAVKFSRN